MTYRWFLLLSLDLLLAGFTVSQGHSAGQDRVASPEPNPAGARLHDFDRRQLTDVYFSEGIAAGDLNGDGHADVVYGPFWFAGPEFTRRHEIFPPVPQNVNHYADHFFCWIEDFNRDGWKDLLVVGFPGTPAFVYENPGPAGGGAHWKKHQVLDSVSNESPQWVNLVGDDRPELVCTRNGYFGFATVDWEKPFEPWKFHAISEQVADKKFGHGLGVGDLNGDGRLDLLHAGGWLEQPAENGLTARWTSHEVPFSTKYGGAEMFAYDVDGDGDLDVLTSDAAHHFGVDWYEQIQEGSERTFRRHVIVGSRQEENPYGVLFSEPHSLRLVDLDGDGLQDLVTGKTYWSHHRKSPMWDAGAVVYWFKLVRGTDGVDWVPQLLDSEAGIGRQVVVQDIDGDGLPDILTGGMKGAHVLRHRVRNVTQKEWQAAQPQRLLPGDLAAVMSRDGEKSVSGKPLEGVIEGEALKPKVSGGSVRPQGMSGFSDDRWSGNSHLWWTGAQEDDTLTIELPEFSGEVDLELVLTGARDYGIVQLSLDGQKIGGPIDLYRTKVVTTGLLTFPKLTVTGNRHLLNVQMLGHHPDAVPGRMFGLDFLRIRKADGTYVAGVSAAPATTGKDEARARTKDGRVLNLDFETGTLQDWVATGDAFTGQPVQGDTVSARRNDMKSGHQGEFWIGGYERHGDRAKGTLTSDPFVVSHPFASFLMNGGSTDKTRVEVIDVTRGEVIFRTSGTDHEMLRPVVVDLRKWVGQEIAIRLIDQHDGGWGHVNFDHFRFHERRPQAPDSSSLPALDDYPHSGLTAEKAAAAMTVPDGFRVQVGAAEPDIQQPIAMAIDDRGRVWIAEAYEYPVRANGDQGRDRILIFEDTNSDGTLDKRTVFLEGLNLVSGLEVGFGGVWIGAAPYLMFVPDANGDDVPDSPPQVLLDGWGYQDTHETLNTFIWGPDGWLYGCHGVFTHSRVGKPGTPDADRLPINAGIWRYHPTRHTFEVFAHGTSNPWGIDFDDYGRSFLTACVIPHLYQVIPGGRYQRQAGQHFHPHTYGDIKTIADHLHYLGASPHGGNSRSDSAGGGHAHAGAMIYLGGRWPEEYRNRIFMNNIHGQRLNTDILKPRGSGMVGSHGPDFLLTGDRASQILNLCSGPDGNVWMIDWYDMQACHTRKIEDHDRSNGRIYKISYGQNESGPVVDLQNRSDRELAELVLHQNDWFVRHGRRMLQERRAARAIDRDAVVRLIELATTHPDDTRRLRGVWCLHVIGELKEETLVTLWKDASPHVRAWSVQLAAESGSGEIAAERLKTFVQLAWKDDSPVVRLALASVAQRIEPERRWDLMQALVSHAEDAQDHNLPLMNWYAIEPLVAVDPARALKLALQVGESIPLIQEFLLRRIGNENSPAALGLLLSGLLETDSPELQRTILTAIQKSLEGTRQMTPPDEWKRASQRILQSPDAAVRLQGIALGVVFGDQQALQIMRSRVEDSAGSVESRLVALKTLLDAKDPGLPNTLLQLLKEEEQLQTAAIRGMAQYDDLRLAPALLSRYARLKPDQKKVALATLCARPESALKLLHAIESQQIPGGDLTADLVQQLRFLKHEELQARLAKVWGTARESAAEKLALIAQYRKLVESKTHAAPDVELGRAVFAKTCMKCHVLYGIGHQIGPDLTGSNRSDLEYLLSNIVDPSAVMAKEYRPVVIATEDGRVVTGLLKGEDARSVTLQTTDALVVIPRSEIEDRIDSEQSMMPEDQLKQFNEQEVRSLIAYLREKQQTPLRATPENASGLFNGRDLTGWSGAQGLWSVENGELIGRTSGLKKNEWLVSDLSVTNFHLKLEVQLVGNAGNSGIQFRSKAEKGEVSGYQADIGPGWWGKLYEEHGRELLWSQSGEPHVKPGEWNSYEIIADGSHIRTLINGQVCVDLDDPTGAKQGILALQLHSGGQTEVRFRNIQLEVLP